MRWLLALALTLFAHSAQGVAPSCWPKMDPPTIVDLTGAPQLGEVVYSASSVGLVWGYTCRTADGNWYKVVSGGAWELFPKDWLFILDTAMRGTDADRKALWDKYATATEWDARLKPDIDKIWAMLPVPPPPPTAGTWVVAPTSICPTSDKDASGKCIRRSTYPWANGVRSTTAAVEKVVIGSACDPAVGAAGFYGVLSRADRVAPCVKR